MAELEIKPSRPMILRVTALAASSAAIVGVLVWLLTGGGVGLLEEKTDLKTYMPDTTGLSVGAPVRLSGIQVGKVRRIGISGYLDGQRSVRVDLRVDKAYLPKIPSDSETGIAADTLIGDKFVDITPGQSKQPVVGNGVLVSEPAESAADKADLVLSLQNSMKKVDAMLVDVASPDSPIGHYVVGDQEYTQMVNGVDLLEKNLRVLAAKGSPAGDAVFSTTLYATFDKSLRDIDDEMQSIQKGEGAAGKLFASDAQYNDMLKQVLDLRKSITQFRESMTKAEPGMLDEEAYRKVTRMLASTDAMLAALNRGEGQAGELLTSPQIYESLVGSMKSLQDMIRDFRANPKKYLRMKAF